MYIHASKYITSIAVVASRGAGTSLYVGGQPTNQNKCCGKSKKYFFKY